MSGPKLKKLKLKKTKRSTVAKGSPPDTRHCDEYIDDPTQPAVLRTWLDRARSPGHGMTSNEPYPKLFADYEGKRVRVTMASRFGDVGIRFDLDEELGYAVRVFVSQLTNFSDTPVTA